MTNKKKHELLMKLKKIRQVVVILLMITSGLWYVTKGRDTDPVTYESQYESNKSFDNRDSTANDSFENHDVSYNDTYDDYGNSNNISIDNYDIPSYQSSDDSFDNYSDVSSTSSYDTDSNLINLNRATLEELDSLPGVGPATAKNIIDYREEYGGFAAIEEIKNVKRIGDKTFEKLKDHITV